MKKVILGMAILSFFIIFNLGEAGAWWGKKEEKKATSTPESAPVAAQVPAPAQQQTPKPKVEKATDKDAAAAKRKQLLAKKGAELNNTEWSAELSPSSAAAKKQIIRITFKDNKVSSSYSVGNFPESNYTLSFGDDGTLIWETMQTSEKQGVIFWRGEIPPDMSAMRGVLSHQFNDKNTDYSFVSTGKETIVPQE